MLIVVAVPIAAFKAVVEMEKLRRQNDKTVINLYIKMFDMVAVLAQYVLFVAFHSPV